MIASIVQRAAIALLVALPLACGRQHEATPSTTDSPPPGRIDTARRTPPEPHAEPRDTAAPARSPFELNPLVPGVRAGKITIGEDIESVARTLGRSDSGDAAMGHAWQFWFSKGSPGSDRATLGVYSVLNDSATHNEVREIMVTSRRFVTAAGVGAGSTLEAIEKAYPSLALAATHESANASDVIAIYDDVAGGIAFEIVRKHGAAASTGGCVAVIVHRKGISWESLKYEI
jgi:hypothetical protein